MLCECGLAQCCVSVWISLVLCECVDLPSVACVCVCGTAQCCVSVWINPVLCECVDWPSVVRVFGSA